MIKMTCAGCGEDCSHAYGTWMGHPYHIGCIPTGRGLRTLPRGEAAQDAFDRDLASDDFDDEESDW